MTTQPTPKGDAEPESAKMEKHPTAVFRAGATIEDIVNDLREDSRMESELSAAKIDKKLTNYSLNSASRTRDEE